MAEQQPHTQLVKHAKDSLRVVGKDEPLPLPLADNTTAEPPKKRSGFRKVMLIGTLFAGAAVGAYAGYHHFVVDRFIEQTDNAYVKTDFTAIAPKVSGYIKDILVNDNDDVRAGQLLARIDDRDFQTALAQAKADLEAASAAVRNVDAQIILQHSLVKQAEAALGSSKAALQFAEADAERARKLIKNGAVTQSRVEQTSSAREQAVAAVTRDQANVVATRDRIPVLETQKQQTQAQRLRAEAQVAQAELNLSYTQITAPVDGTIGARTLRNGQLVSAGTQLMAVVPLDAAYVVANFKETQLTDIRPGQPVTMTVDTFPGLQIMGRVESLSPGSGSEFSLIPADNATGNFTKIVQRVPVKISFKDPMLAGKLRSGMSVIPSVDTNDGNRRVASWSTFSTWF